MDFGFSLPIHSLPLVCIVAAAVCLYVPYGLVAYARLQVGLNASAPRTMFDSLPDYAKRAQWAHQNSFEMFPPFAAAALMVYITGPHAAVFWGQTGEVWAALSSVGFVLSRLSYSACYVADIPWARSLSWAVTVSCTGILMLISLQSLFALG